MAATLTQVTSIVSKFAKNQERLVHVSDSTSFRNDLGVSSTSLIDIVLDLEDTFHITIEDDELKQIDTVGSAVALIEAKQRGSNN